MTLSMKKQSQSRHLQTPLTTRFLTFLNLPMRISKVAFAMSDLSHFLMGDVCIISVEEQI